MSRSTNLEPSVTALAEGPTPGLPAHDPDSMRFQQYTGALYAHDPVAVGVGALYIASVPPEKRSSETIAERLNGPGHAAIAEAVYAEGVRRSEPLLDEADGHLLAAKDCNDQLEQLAEDRCALPDELVQVAGGLYTRAQVRSHRQTWLRLAERRALAGDTDHEDQAGRGIWGWVVAVAVAAIEAGITLKVFNVSFTSLTLNVLTWLAVTVALVAFNHLVIKLAGRAIREHREIHKQNRLINAQAAGVTNAKYYGGTR